MVCFQLMCTFLLPFSLLFAQLELSRGHVEELKLQQSKKWRLEALDDWKGRPPHWCVRAKGGTRSSA